MKIYQRFMSVCLFFLMSLPLYAGNDSDPVAMLKSVANTMLNNLEKNKSSLKKNPGVVYGMTRKIIVPHADLNEMSKRVLPPQTWNTATAAQRAQFKKEFTTTLIRTYASALASYDDQSVVFYPVRGGWQGKKTLNVNSQIERSDGPPVSVSYRLIKVGASWKLIDMTVEGISMLESFRSQFADQLNRGDMANLLIVLQRHNTKNNVEQS